MANCLSFRWIIEASASSSLVLDANLLFKTATNPQDERKAR